MMTVGQQDDVGYTHYANKASGSVLRSAGESGLYRPSAVAFDRRHNVADGKKSEPNG